MINVWYSGDQSFTTGTPQVWINLRGTASDPESGAQGLICYLNGSGPRYLNLGPDQRRLADPGDFNVDISIYDGSLVSGTNTVLLRAMNGAIMTGEATIRFTYLSGNAWPLHYSVNWKNAVSLQAAAQVVDGKWQVTASGVRTAQMARDRVLAIGDITRTVNKSSCPLPSTRSMPPPTTGLSASTPELASTCARRATPTTRCRELKPTAAARSTAPAPGRTGPPSQAGCLPGRLTRAARGAAVRAGDHPRAGAVKQRVFMPFARQ